MGKIDLFHKEQFGISNGSQLLCTALGIVMNRKVVLKVLKSCHLNSRRSGK